MRAVCARTRQVHIILHPNAHTYSHAHAPTQTNNLGVSRSSKQPIGHVGFSYYFQRGQFWSPLHVYIGVVSSVISADAFPLLFPVSKINSISNCLVLPYQRKNMIYETSSHEKPILRDYLLITETAQLTDKGKRVICGEWETRCTCKEDGGRVWTAYYILMWRSFRKTKTLKRKVSAVAWDICLSSSLSKKKKKNWPAL